MKRYFAYIRVSTVKQGEKGSSLQEQKSAIEGYARRHNLPIAEWFEEKETAAKQGRRVFSLMLNALDQGLATGVITHKIDRSARNLRDWATLGELVDRGIELHFAHESIDLTSRGGRLSADIQAVVAADYIRNLRDEVRKGFYGRLKQGLYPLSAPLGYTNQGGGIPKSIDPVRGPFVAKAFELYATGRWSLDTISEEFFRRGLRSRVGARVTRNGFSSMFNNPFYFGLIRIEKTHEVFQGIHPALVDKSLFDRVQAVLQGRVTHKAQVHRFRYQRTIRCESCGRSLIGSRHKGYIYYRCQTKSCPTTCLREEHIDQALRAVAARFRLSDEEWAKAKDDIETIIVGHKTNVAGELQTVSLAMAAIDARLSRLTDAYVDQLIDRETYLGRKEQLLGERASAMSWKASLEAGDEGFRHRVEKILERLKALGNMPNLPNDDRLRDLLKDTTSNFSARQKTVVVAWENPFQRLLNEDVVTAGGDKRIKPRTSARKISKIILNHCAPPAEKHEEPKPPLDMAA